MDTRTKSLLGGAAVCALMGGLLTPANAQTVAPGTTGVTQNPFEARAATFSTGNTRTSCTTSQDSVANLTLTVPALAGQFFYLQGVVISVAGNGTGAASAVSWSSVNLPGTPTYLTNGQVSAVEYATQQVNEWYPYGLKATAPGVAVTLTPNATMASAFQCAKIYGYYNPQ